MADATNITAAAKPAAAPAGRGGFGGRGQQGQGGRGGYGQNRDGGRGGDRRGGRRQQEEREKPEFEQKILDLARVTRVTKGGKRMRFRACLLIGDRNGRVGIGLAKGLDVAAAVEKAFRQAKKNLITVSMANTSIPHDVRYKYGAAAVLLKPAPKGTGLKSGGAVRLVLELAGVKDAVSKITGGSKNKINNARATFKALGALKPAKPAK